MRYRDKLTGRLVSKSTWTRSKAHGGTRYVRQSSKGVKDARARSQKPATEKTPKDSTTPYGKGAASRETPAPPKVVTAKDYFDYYYYYDLYEDQGEIDTGVDY